MSFQSEKTHGRNDEAFTKSDEYENREASAMIDRDDFAAVFD